MSHIYIKCLKSKDSRTKEEQWHKEIERMRNQHAQPKIFPHIYTKKVNQNLQEYELIWMREKEVNQNSVQSVD